VAVAHFAAKTCTSSRYLSYLQQHRMAHRAIANSAQLVIERLMPAHTARVETLLQKGPASYRTRTKFNATFRTLRMPILNTAIFAFWALVFMCWRWVTRWIFGEDLQGQIRHCRSIVVRQSVKRLQPNKSFGALGEVFVVVSSKRHERIYFAGVQNVFIFGKPQCCLHGCVDLAVVELSLRHEQEVVAFCTTPCIIHNTVFACCCIMGHQTV